jgi:hypothetical protein
MLEEIEKLKVDVGMLKTCSEDRSIKFSGLGIRSIQECLLWVNKHFETYRYGLMMDPLLMLDRIFGAR